MIIASTAYMNQLATRTFRVILRHEGSEYSVHCQAALGQSMYYGHYFPYTPGNIADQHRALSEASSLFGIKATRYILQTDECGAAGFEPFIEASSYNPTQPRRWQE